MPTLNDVLAGSLAQAVQVQQIIDAMKGTPSKGVPVAFVSLNDPSNYALSVQNDDPTNSRALSVLNAAGGTLILADGTGVTLGSPLNLTAGSVAGTALANASVTNAKLATDTARLNLLVNGGLELWQRGTGPFTAAAAYSADRWQNNPGGTSTFSVSRDTSNVDSPASAACAAITYTHNLESQYRQVVEDFTQLRGKTVSFSIRVRCATASAVRAWVNDGTTNSYSSYHPGTGAYVTLTVTATLSSSASTVQVGADFMASCTAYVDNAMLVVGSVAADYAPLTPADDLARCLRYYEIVGESTTTIAFSGYAAAGATMQYALRYLHKPVTPTVTKVGTWTVSNCAQPTVGGNGFDASYIQATVTALGMAQFYNGTAGNNVTVEANP